MGKKSGPDAKGAASIQGDLDRATARDVTYADRPDQYNKWGNVQWTQEDVYRDSDYDEEGNLKAGATPETQKWVQNQSLSEDAEQLYNTNLGMLRGKTNLAGGMMGRISDEMGGAADWDQFGDVQGLDYNPNQIRGMAEDAAYNKEAARLDPRFKSQQDELEIKLRNRGLREGDQAYDSAMSNLGKERSDAFEQARYGATNIGRQEADQMYGQQRDQSQYANALRSQQIQEYLGKRTHSLDEQAKLQEGQGLGDLLTMAGGG